MLNGLYGYFFGGEDANDNNTKENVAVLSDSIDLFASPNEISEIKDDDWVLLDEHISGRSTPVIVPEPDLIAIDDDLLTTFDSHSHQSSDHSPFVFQIARDFETQQACRKRAERAEKLRQARQRAQEKRELERKLFEDQVLRPSSEQVEKKQQPNNAKVTNIFNNAAKMKRSTAAGHFAAETKTKQRSKKTNRLIAGRNNDRKVNNLN